MEALSPPKKILVVEDELDVRLFVSNLLASNGFIPIDAENFRQGFHLARSLQPDLIILDAMLPEEGGIELIRLLKSDPQLRSVPVAIMTTFDRKTFCHFQRCMGVKEIFEPEAFLARPPEADELLQVIRRLV